MASRFRLTLKKIVPVRTFATQTAAKTNSDRNIQGTNKPIKSTLGNGLNLITLENNSPVANLAVIVRAGSKDEDNSQLGLTHCIRSLAGLDTENSTIFRLTRTLQLHGAIFNITSTRENIIYSTQCLSNSIPEVSRILYEVAFQSAFKHWQIKDFAPKLRNDLAIYNTNPLAVLIEKLHFVSFKGGLSNSLYSPEHMIGKHTTDMLDEFICQRYTPQNIAYVAQGVNHQELGQLLENEALPPASEKPVVQNPSKFKSGELRIENDTSITYTAIASEGVSLKNKKEALAQALLQEILGTHPLLQYNQGLCSKLIQAASKASPGQSGVSTFSQSYSDAGIFGLVAATPTNDTSSILKECVNQMKNVMKATPSDSDLNDAKQRLKASLLLSLDKPEICTEEMAQKALMGEGLECTTLADIDSISASDVAAVSAKIAKSKPALVTMGKLNKSPYLDELL